MDILRNIGGYVNTKYWWNEKLIKKIMKMFEKTLKNYIRSNNRYFEVFLLEKFIYVWYSLSYLIIISCASIKNINFVSIHLLLSYIKYC